MVFAIKTFFHEHIESAGKKAVSALVPTIDS